MSETMEAKAPTPCVDGTHVLIRMKSGRDVREQLERVKRDFAILTHGGNLGLSPEDYEVAHLVNGEWQPLSNPALNRPEILVQPEEGQCFGMAERARLQEELRRNPPGRAFVMESGVRIVQLVNGVWQPVPMTVAAPTRRISPLVCAIAVAVSFAVGILLARML